MAKKNKKKNKGGRKHSKHTRHHGRHRKSSGDAFWRGIKFVAGLAVGGVVGAIVDPLLPDSVSGPAVGMAGMGVALHGFKARALPAVFAGAAVQVVDLATNTDTVKKISDEVVKVANDIRESKPAESEKPPKKTASLEGEIGTGAKKFADTAAEATKVAEEFAPLLSVVAA